MYKGSLLCLLSRELDKVHQMLERTQEIALAELRGVDVAVEREDTIGSGVDGREAYEWTSHKVVFDIPQSAHLCPQTTSDAHHAVVRLIY